MKIAFSFLLIMVLSTTMSWAQMGESTAGCHCFKERDFNPGKKFAADEYLLATSFNSFLAVNFDISKSQIVMMKMKGGIDPDTLLVALYVAREGKVQLDSVLAVLENGGTWEQVLNSSSIKGTPQVREVFTAIAATGENQGEAAEIVTDELLKSFFGMKDLEIRELRTEKTTGRELVLANILAQHSERNSSATDILIMSSRQQKSWGEIAHYFGFTPKETGTLLKRDAP